MNTLIFFNKFVSEMRHILHLPFVAFFIGLALRDWQQAVKEHDNTTKNIAFWMLLFLMLWFLIWAIVNNV